MRVDVTLVKHGSLEYSYMPVVNLTNTLYLGHTGPVHTINDMANVINTLDDDYWYIEFSNEDSFAYLEDVLTTEVLSDIRNGKFKLCMCNVFEAFHTVVEPIYQFIIRHDIPAKQVTLVTESNNICETIEEVARKYNMDMISAIWSRIAERLLSSSNHYKDPPETLHLTHYDKKFLNFNRRRRPHRATLVALLDILNLRDKGYISLGVSDGNNGWDAAWNDITTYIKDESMLELFNTNKERIFNIPDLYLDRTDLSVNCFEHDIMTDEYYSNSYFSLVSETYFFKESTIRDPFGFSEKIFKPILNKHPFIVAGKPNSLSLLRTLGYKTFDTIIDESYDTEEADDIRLMMVANEVKRLCELDEQALKNFLDKAREIVEYNYIVLMKKRRKDCITMLGK